MPDHALPAKSQYHQVRLTITQEGSGLVTYRPVSYTHLTLPTIYSV